MYDIGFVEIMSSLFVTVSGTLYWKQIQLEKMLATKVDKEDFKEIRKTLKEILNSICEIKIDQARWQTLAENLEKQNSGNS